MSSTPNNLSTEPREDDPGAFPITFSFNGVELGSRLDSIPPSARYWAVDPQREHAPWYNEIVEANNHYEEWLSTRPPEEYPVPFRPADGKRIDEIDDDLRHWGVRPDRSCRPWYSFFVRANRRYEQHLAETREPGEFPYPPGNYRGYTGRPIKDVPQDKVWWALRSSNRNQSWYQPLFDANKRLLDDVYKVRSPGSEPIWFGKKYRGLRLDQVCQRKNYLRWCFHPDRAQQPMFRRLKDLVDRLKEWQRVHHKNSGPRQRRKAPNIQNPVGEAVGPWDDSLGSADEDDYEKDSFIQSDDEELEYASDDDDDGDEMEDGDISDSDGSMSSSVETNPPTVGKRRWANVVNSNDESASEADISARRLGKRYRVKPLQHESSEE